MNLQLRIDLLDRLGEYILSGDPLWQRVKERAGQENGWFTPEFVDLASSQIARAWLQKDVLEKWLSAYPLKEGKDGRTVGIVMAGNIPLVGFHDLLCVFISGHRAAVKTSSKDQVLINHLVEKMEEWTPEVDAYISFADMLKGCDAYIATGNNNTSRYFEYYFGKYPHIIRRNRTSAAVLNGDETVEELEKLADDVYMYFGLGCRNVTKLYVPAGYDFLVLLATFKKYQHLSDHYKYKNNYDYNLALALLNRKYYMTNGSILLIEESSLFSPISQLNYEFYSNKQELMSFLQTSKDLQCIVGKEGIPFGQAQFPHITDYADGTDTVDFLANI